MPQDNSQQDPTFAEEHYEIEQQMQVGADKVSKEAAKKWDLAKQKTKDTSEKAEAKTEKVKRNFKDKWDEFIH